MSVERSVRVNELAKRVVSTILQREYAHTKLGWVTVSRVIVSKDLQHARVFFTVLGTDEDEQRVMNRLQADKAHLRFLLGNTIRLRYTPELIFEVDEELKKAMRIDRLLEEAQIDSQDNHETNG